MRTQGTRYLLAAYDLRDDVLWGHPYERQRWGEVLDFFKDIRARYPSNERLYIVLDNRSSHKKHDVLVWAKTHKITLVFTPTYCTWINRIECHFTALRKFVLSGRYFATHDEQNAAIKRYLIYRNAQRVKPTAKHPDIRVNLC